MPSGQAQRPGSRELSFRDPVMSMPEATLTTGTITIELLADVCVAMEVIDQHITAWAMEAMKDPQQGPALRRVIEQLLEVVEGSPGAADAAHTREPHPMSDGGS